MLGEIKDEQTKETPDSLSRPTSSSITPFKLKVHGEKLGSGDMNKRWV